MMDIRPNPDRLFHVVYKFRFSILVISSELFCDLVACKYQGKYYTRYM